MARDRQRGKQRRARPSSGGAPAARPARPRDEASPQEPLAFAGDGTDGDLHAGIRDVLDEAGPQGTTPAPDPLKHGSPYADEARLAEAGAPMRAPDAGERPKEELGYSATAAEDSAPERAAGVEAAPSRRGGPMSFLRQSAEELKRVQWPDRRQTGQGTAVTLGFVVLAGGFLGLMDVMWKPIVEAII